MFSKSNLLATLVGGAVMFFLGYLVWGMALSNFFASRSLVSMEGNVPHVEIVGLANLIMAFVMATLFGKWSRGQHSLSEGFKFGAWIGVFAGLGMGLLGYGTMAQMDLTGYLVAALVHILFYGTIGAIIALVYQKTAGAE